MAGVGDTGGIAWCNVLANVGDDEKGVVEGVVVGDAVCDCILVVFFAFKLLFLVVPLCCQAMTC